MLNFGGRIDSFITIFLVIAMLLGIVSANNKMIDIKRLNDKLDGQDVRVFGTVASVPEKGKYQTAFIFDGDRVLSGYGEFDNLKIYVKSDEEYNLKFGDRLIFNAYIESAETANLKLGKHYLSKGTLFIADNIVLLDKGSASGLYKVLAVVRNYIIGVGNNLLKGDARELFKALTAGDKTGFSNNFTSNLNKSGLSHIACVSGLHVSILGMAVLNLLKKRGKVLSAAVALGVVYAFAFITGASPSALRAAMMFTSFIIAKVSLRDNDGFTSLCFSAMILALINPYVMFDWGFILSFLSVLGIQVFSYFFKDMLRFLPEALADSVSVTMSAQLMTLPAVVNMFGYISTYSVFANIVISMIFLWVLYMCFIAIALSFIPWVNQLAGIVCMLGLDAVIAVARLFADLPVSILKMDRFDVVEIVVYYSLVLVFIFRKKISAYFMGTAITACIALLLISAFVPFNITHKYAVADESNIFVTEDKAVLLAKDALWDISAELDDTLNYTAFTDVVLAGDVTGQENAVVDMRKTIKAIHISEEYKNSSFASLVQRIGCDLKYYPSDMDLEVYVENILK